MLQTRCSVRGIASSVFVKKRMSQRWEWGGGGYDCYLFQTSMVVFVVVTAVAMISCLYRKRSIKKLGQNEKKKKTKKHQQHRRRRQF